MSLEKMVRLMDRQSGLPVQVAGVPVSGAKAQINAATAPTHCSRPDQLPHLLHLFLSYLPHPFHLGWRLRREYL